jgi:aspartyl-tRNA(Asn)/glutamyl-tRNA(Gln) amidotransferase subunit C
MSKISEAEVRRIALLAHLALDDAEVKRMTRELHAIIGYVKQLEQVDCEGVPAMAHMHLDAMPLRADEALASLPRELVLAQAARAADDGFAVPSFVDEG